MRDAEARLPKCRIVLTKVSNDFARSFESITRSDLLEYLGGVTVREDYPEWTKLSDCQFAKRFFGWRNRERIPFVP